MFPYIKAFFLLEYFWTVERLTIKLCNEVWQWEYVFLFRETAQQLVRPVLLVLKQGLTMTVPDCRAAVAVARYVEVKTQ